MNEIQTVDDSAGAAPARSATRLPAPPVEPAPPRVPEYLGKLATRTGPMLLYQLNRLGGSGAAGATILLFAIVFFFSAVLPQQRDLAALEEQIREAHHLSQTAEPAPARLNRFMNTLPKRSELPAIMGQVFAQAGLAGITLDHGRYELSPTRAGHLAQYRMTFPIKGRYPDIRKFIDSVLSTVPSAALEGMRVERKAIGDENVTADLRLSIFVRTDS